MSDKVKVNNCKLCGREAYMITTNPSESMHSGWVSVNCACGQTMKLGPRDVCPTGRAGETGWEWNYRALTMAEAEVKRRWNIINSGSVVS